MVIDSKTLIEIIQISIIGLVFVAFASFVFAFIKHSTGKLFKKVDEDYITLTRFIELCSQKQSSCIVVKDFSKRMEDGDKIMEGLVKAMKILIVHTITDKDEQERALQALK